MMQQRMAADLTQKPTAADLTGTGTLIGNRRNMRRTGQKAAKQNSIAAFYCSKLSAINSAIS
jgi:hypothetical protein